MRSPVPHVGSWYKEIGAEQIFEVVAYDNRAQTIEVQLLAGEVDEYDLESWAEMELVPVEEPEDWRNPYEIDREDFTEPEQALQPLDWDDPLEQVEPDQVNGLLDLE